MAGKMLCPVCGYMVIERKHPRRAWTEIPLLHQVVAHIQSQHPEEVQRRLYESYGSTVH